MNKNILLLTAVSLFSLQSYAQDWRYKGSISFTEREKRTHVKRINEFNQTAAQCLNNYREEHLDFYRSNCKTIGGKKVCLSSYYGDRKYTKTRGALRSDGKELIFLGDALQKIGFPASYMKKMKNISCVGMALNCLKTAFTSTDQRNIWNKVNSFTRENEVSGTALQYALGKLGWTTHYWNPSYPGELVEEAKKWDEQEAEWESKGYHWYRYIRMQRNNYYWGNFVDDMTSLVGFEAGEPDLIQDVPFWIATANTGYHVFPGTYGNVVEAHSTRSLTARDNLEFSRFAPFAPGGGPRWTRKEKYRSGLFVTPPKRLRNRRRRLRRWGPVPPRRYFSY